MSSPFLCMRMVTFPVGNLLGGVCLLFFSAHQKACHALRLSACFYKIVPLHVLDFCCEHYKDETLCSLRLYCLLVRSMYRVGFEPFRTTLLDFVCEDASQMV